MPPENKRPIDNELRQTNIGRKLLYAFDAFESRIVDGIQQAGFSDFKASDGSALRNVDLAGTRLTEMARRAHMTKQGMGQLVRDLERRRYVRVTADPDDGRARRVILTKKGRELIAAGQRVYRELERDWVGVLGEREFRRLQRALDRLVDAEGSQAATHDLD